MEDIEQVWDVLDGWSERIFKQMVNMYHRRVVYESMLEMLQEQNHPDAGLFLGTYNGQYIEAQSMAIRRQADEDDRTISAPTSQTAGSSSCIHYTRVVPRPNTPPERRS